MIKVRILGEAATKAFTQPVSRPQAIPDLSAQARSHFPIAGGYNPDKGFDTVADQAEYFPPADLQNYMPQLAKFIGEIKREFFIGDKVSNEKVKKFQNTLKHERRPAKASGLTKFNYLLKKIYNAYETQSQEQFNKKPESREQLEKTLENHISQIGGSYADQINSFLRSTGWMALKAIKTPDLLDENKLKQIINQVLQEMKQENAK